MIKTDYVTLICPTKGTKSLKIFYKMEQGMEVEVYRLVNTELRNSVYRNRYKRAPLIDFARFSNLQINIV